MTYRVVVLARARLDVEALYDWIAERSAEGAQRWLDAFEKATAVLATNPFIAPLAPESHRFDHEIRQILFRTRAGRTYRAVFTMVGEEVRDPPGQRTGAAPAPARGHHERVTGRLRLIPTRVVR